MFPPGGGDRQFADFLVNHADSLWIGHSVSAEMKYLFRLGHSPARRWYDTLLAERWLTNSDSRVEVGLTAVLERRGLHSHIRVGKEKYRAGILRLDFDPADSGAMANIAEYCLADCRACAALYRAQQEDPRITERLDKVMSWWPEYLRAVARMELRGIPVDTGSLRSIRRHSGELRERLIGSVNAVAPVMRSSGIDRRRFARWCQGNNVPLPRVYDRDRGGWRYSVESETIKEIEHHHPFVAKVREVQKTAVALRSNSLVVDAVAGRHYFEAVPFRTITGRNAPKRFLFNGAKWLRFLVVAEDEEHVLLYADYTAQEIGIAAALSADKAMRTMYWAEDPHLYFAVQAGAAPIGATKASYAAVRRKYKTVNLGVLYGQTPEGTARKLGISRQEAETLHRQHKATYPVFWGWVERMVANAYWRGETRTRLLWRCTVRHESNERTWRNWPMQAAGADIMRLTVMYLDRAGLELLAPLHDGFLLSCRRDALTETRKAVDDACAAAVRHVLPDFPLRWDTTIYKNRFEDADGRQIWSWVQEQLRELEDGRQGGGDVDS